MYYIIIAFGQTPPHPYSCQSCTKLSARGRISVYFSDSPINLFHFPLLLTLLPISLAWISVSHIPSRSSTLVTLILPTHPSERSSIPHRFLPHFTKIHSIFHLFGKNEDSSHRLMLPLSFMIHSSQSKLKRISTLTFTDQGTLQVHDKNTVCIQNVANIRLTFCIY